MHPLTLLFIILSSGWVCVQSEMFSSTAQLNLLRKSENEMPQILDDFIIAEEERLTKLMNFIATMRVNAAGVKGAIPYAAHPVNAYHLMRRWYQLRTLAIGIEELPKFTEFLRKNNIQMPHFADYAGAAEALLRLQRAFNISTADMALGKIHEWKSAKPLDFDDFYFLGKRALQTQDYGLSAQWFELATKNPNKKDGDESYFWLARNHYYIKDYVSAVAAGKMALLQDPENATVVTDYSNYIQWMKYEKNTVNMYTWQRNIDDAKKNYELLCRGTNAPRAQEILSSLTCRYKRGLLPYVVYKEETLSWEPHISMFYDVLSDNDGQFIKSQAADNLMRASVGVEGVVANSRVSKLSWLFDSHPADNYRVKQLSTRVTDITGLVTDYRDIRASAEAFQVVNYGIGGQYEPHTDYFEEVNAYEKITPFLRGSGDRLATFLFYLSDVQHGGSTVFPYVNVRVPVVKNAAAFWYNSKPSGEYDILTTHAGCPVLIGEKWVANKWIHEYGNEFRSRCALDKDAAWDL